MTLLSGSRPIVAISPTSYSFNTVSSSCRMSLGIVSSSGLSIPTVRKAPPPAVYDFHHNHRDVVRAAAAIGRVDQVVTDSLRIPQFSDCLGERPFRNHAGQTVAAQEQVVAGLQRHF